MPTLPMFELPLTQVCVDLAKTFWFCGPKPSLGSSDDGRTVICWNSGDDYDDHMWLIQPVPSESETFTIRNLKTGTYMDLSGGFHKTNPGKNQKWIIRKEETDGSRWKIQNKAAGTAHVMGPPSWDGRDAGRMEHLLDTNTGCLRDSAPLLGTYMLNSVLAPTSGKIFIQTITTLITTDIYIPAKLALTRTCQVASSFATPVQIEVISVEQHYTRDRRQGPRVCNEQLTHGSVGVVQFIIAHGRTGQETES
ncbi:hypothetical protein DFH07DRAFT_782318 [Mycena maculata]|uniref:Ricin B lectin domain-containing protein n=1 Tax=Mycena maculata TaxID=230809 RepID=A0AAD7HV22_9AGAR|nr:hypothetical protein DFH07DRAFT_782318 [Mycena maculata]